jgi:hypothetical protein
MPDLLREWRESKGRCLRRDEFCKDRAQCALMDEQGVEAIGGAIGKLGVFGSLMSMTRAMPTNRLSIARARA